MTDAEWREAALARLRPFVERARGFSGWDLSAIRERPLDPGPPWDYEAVVREEARGRQTALDLGTGGGEVLARLRDALPGRLVATEEWGVNAPVAALRLAPLGVRVVRCAWQHLPFAGGAFDLVLDRHEALDPVEIARVLAPGGRLVTQQVGGSAWQALHRFFPRMEDFRGLFDQYVEGLEAAGLRVAGREHDYRVALESLGDVAYALAIMPWRVPDFDLERDLDALLALEAERTTPAGLVLTDSRFLIVAEKPIR
jgi:SAM-dependent methyltransferase